MMTGAPRPNLWVFAALMVAIGFNLRIPLGNVPALLPVIERELELSRTNFGMLTTITVIAMGVSAPLGPVIARHLGVVRALTILMWILGAGGLMRLVSLNVPLLFASAIISGCGMGGTTAILPGMIARIAPSRLGTILGLYSSSMALGLGVAAATSHSVSLAVGGWRPALAAWGILAIVVGLLWWLIASRADGWFPTVPPPFVAAHSRLPLRSASAWLVTLVVSATMCVGMTCVAWLVPIGVGRGASEGDAANLLLLFQLVQLVTMLGVPALGDRFLDRRPMLMISQVSMLIGVLMLIPESLPGTVVAIALVAGGLGSATSLGLMFIADVGGTALGAARLGGLAFLISFLAGAVAPGVFGFSADLTGTFTTGLLVTAAPVALAVVLGFRLHPGRSL